MRLFKAILLIAVLVAPLYASADLTSLPTKTVNGVQYYYYTVRPGDTVYSLSREFGVAKDDIVKYNPSVANGLQAYQTLLFPATISTVKQSQANRVNSTTSSVVAASSVQTYEVKKGDTGYGISKRYGMTTEEFYQLNPSARDGIKIGQVVKVKSANTGQDAEQAKTTVQKNIVAPVSVASTANTHVIQPGETLYQIARENDLTVTELLVANPQLDPALYEVGQVINLPSGTKNEVAQVEASVISEAADNEITKLPSDFLADDSDPITTPSTSIFAQSDTIAIALVLPFNASAEKRDSRSQRAIEFYRGFVVAIDSMRNYGTPIKLIVLDSKGTDEGAAAALLDKRLLQADIIVAPDAANQLENFAAYALRHKKYLLNLFVIKDNLYLTNPYIMQANIPHGMMYDKASNYFTSQFSTTTPVILKRKGGKEDKIEFVETLKNKLAQSGKKYHEIEYTDKLSLATLDNLPTSMSESYSFLPVSSSMDELNKCIDAVVKFKENHPANNINLWGYSEWLTARGDNQKKLNDADTYIFSRFFSVEKDEEEQQFQSQYEKWYGTKIMDKVPKQGTYGFDTGMYLIKAINSNQGDFRTLSPRYNGIQNVFHFDALSNGGFVNGEMYIIHFTPSGSIFKQAL